ncbi:hypothetical protein L7F22_001375 [Adiantum nelumboides]|nr:hypothetical protein [Adiantum nelumboides]
MSAEEERLIDFSTMDLLNDVASLDDATWAIEFLALQEAMTNPALQAPAGKKVTCANNASYPIKGVGKILITILDGSDLCLLDVLYVPGIKKNLLSVSSLAKNDLRVIFEDDRCIVRDRENGYSLITTEEIVREEQEVLKEERTLSKCVQKTLQDSKLDAPLPRKTRASTTFGREQVDLACFSTLCDTDDPNSFEQALECVQWKDAMQQEIDSIHKNHTWDLVDLPTGKKPTGTKWGFKVKRKQDDTVDIYKARIVAKGYAQQKGIHYDETFALTSHASTIRSLVAIAAHHGWKVHQLDIKIAFLNGDLQKEVYVIQPSGFVVKGQEQKVCRLRKALYGLKQSPRAWYEKIHTYLIKQGFLNSPTESTLYVKRRNAVLIMLTLYVDYMLLTGNNENENAAFKDALRKTFEMSDLGLLHYYLGIQFVQSEDGIYMSQK